jgi:heme exporter protein D
MTLHLEAGKYALYLWPAYGLSAVVIAALVVEALLKARRWRRAAEALDGKGAQPGPGDGV